MDVNLENIIELKKIIEKYPINLTDPEEKLILEDISSITKILDEKAKELKEKIISEAKIDPNDEAKKELEETLSEFNSKRDIYPLIPFRIEFKEITGSTNAAILLQQILYWLGKNNYFEIHKRIEPKKLKSDEDEEDFYRNYKYFNSFTEELCLSIREFKTARDKIMHKKGEEIDPNWPPIKKCIQYRLGSGKMPYYKIVNFGLLKSLIEEQMDKSKINFAKKKKYRG